MEKNKSKLESNFELVRQLKKGEKSGFVKNFDRKNFLNNLHKKHLK